MPSQYPRTPARARFFPTGLLSFTLGLLLLGGCASLSTKEPLSENPEPIDREKLEGVWLMEMTTGGETNKHLYHLRYNKDGVAQIVGWNWSNDQFDLLRMEAIVTRGSSRNYVSLRAMNDQGEWPDEYFLMTYDFPEKDLLALRFANVERFAQLVADGKLQGVATKARTRKATMPTIFHQRWQVFLSINHMWC